MLKILSRKKNCGPLIGLDLIFEKIVLFLVKNGVFYQKCLFLRVLDPPPKKNAQNSTIFDVKNGTFRCQFGLFSAKMALLGVCLYVKLNKLGGG